MFAGLYVCVLLLCECPQRPFCDFVYHIVTGRAVRLSFYTSKQSFARDIFDGGEMHKL